MVYGTPIEQLEDRYSEFHKSAISITPMTRVYLADALYHRGCIILQNKGIKKEHPKIKEAQTTYVNALLDEANGSKLKDVVDGILYAADKLQTLFLNKKMFPDRRL